MDIYKIVVNASREYYSDPELMGSHTLEAHIADCIEREINQSKKENIVQKIAEIGDDLLKYHKLLLTVKQKFPNESRYETAARELKNKYSNLWELIYVDMINDLLSTMNQADIQQYKDGNKNCRIKTIANNAAFIVCNNINKLLANNG